MLRMMDKELYQAVLLQHSKCPRNFGLMEDSTHRSEGHNALCGDEISVTLKIEKEVVSEVKFTGSACVICTASASMMTNEVKGADQQVSSYDPVRCKPRFAAEVGDTRGCVPLSPAREMCGAALGNTYSGHRISR